MIRNVNSSAWKYDSEALNTSATLIEALLANNALSVVGNVPINVTTTEGSDDSAVTETSSFSSTDSSSSLSPSETSSISSDDSSSATPAPSTSVAARVRRQMKRQAATTAPTVSATRTSTRTSASRANPTVAINYLGAVVAARNLTVGGLNASSAPTPSPTGKSNDGPNTGLAMIILYSITGVGEFRMFFLRIRISGADFDTSVYSQPVTFLFFAVILCGAVRAIRYPERYGPRAGFGYGNRASGSGPNGGAQNRAQGLARAVLDTFPIVRFGGGGTDAEGQRRRDEEAGKGEDGDSHKDLGKEDGDEVELVRLAPTLSAVPRSTRTESNRSGEEIEELATQDRPHELRTSISTNSFHSAASLPPPVGQSDPSLGILSVVGPSPVDSTSAPSNLAATSPSRPDSTTQPSSSTSTTTPAALDSVNDEDHLSCPICVCDFAEGDSIRILPCDARHQFHVECIDPWLLGVSRLCPLCRLDLGENRGEVGGSGGTADASQSAGRDGGVEELEGDREARERERERHEEERVVRHLRGLLNRGSTSTSTSTSDNAGGRNRTRSTSESLDLAGGGVSRDTVGLRSRFAKYVAVRRRRRDTTSSGSPTSPSPPNELNSS